MGIPNWSGLYHQRRGKRLRYGNTQPTANSLPSAELVLALLIILIITVACFNMAFLMSPGLPVTANPASRIVFLQENTLVWQLGWLTWMASAIGLLTFSFMLLTYIPHSTFRHFGLALIAIGIGPDLTAETLYAFVLPEISHVSTFNVIDRIAMLLTGLVGNGAYCLGGLILNWLLLGNPRLPRSVIYFGLPSWLVGLAISLATAINQIHYAAVFTGVAMVWNVIWMFIFSLVVIRNKSSYQVK